MWPSVRYATDGTNESVIPLVAGHLVAKVGVSESSGTAERDLCPVDVCAGSGVHSFPFRSSLPIAYYGRRAGYSRQGKDMAKSFARFGPEMARLACHQVIPQSCHVGLQEIAQNLSTAMECQHAKRPVVDYYPRHSVQIAADLEYLTLW